MALEKQAVENHFQVLDYWKYVLVSSRVVVPCIQREPTVLAVRLYQPPQLVCFILDAHELAHVPCANTLVIDQEVDMDLEETEPAKLMQQEVGAYLLRHLEKLSEQSRAGSDGEDCLVIVVWSLLQDVDDEIHQNGLS